MASHLFHSSAELTQIEAKLKAGRSSEDILRNVDETLRTAGEGVELLADQRYYYDGPITFFNMSPSDEIPAPPEVLTHDMVSAMAYPLTQAHRRGLRIAITFGVATSHALQNLRTTEPSFDTWWAPRSRALNADELCRYFYLMRSVLLKEGYLKATTALSEYRVTEDRNWIEVVTHLHAGPRTHRGADVSGQSALDLVELYLGYLGEIVAEAWTEFCPGIDSTARTLPAVRGPMTVERADPREPASDEAKAGSSQNSAD